VGGDALPQGRAADPRRVSLGGAGLDRSACIRHPAPARVHARARFHGRLLRNRCRAHHHRFDRAVGARQTAAFDQLVALRAAVAGRNGDHRPRGGDPAATRDRREPDHEDGDPGTDEGHPAYSTHHRNRQRPVAGLRGDDARVRFGFQGGGDGLVRCRGPCVLDPEPGGILLRASATSIPRQSRLRRFSSCSSEASISELTSSRSAS